MNIKFETIAISIARFLVVPLFFLGGLSSVSAQHLAVNEFSRGDAGAREYIELVVAGNRTCAGDSCLDIRGWIIDDINGWCGAGAGQGIATGHMRFSNDPNWSCVPYGSIILLYNSGDVNTSIALANDPTDANNDNVYGSAFKFPATGKHIGYASIHLHRLLMCILLLLMLLEAVGIR